MHAAHNTIWQTIDQTLLGLAARAGDLDAEIGRWLVAASREGVHRHFGFASFAEYVERRLGFDARTTRPVSPTPLLPSSQRKRSQP